MSRAVVPTVVGIRQVNPHMMTRVIAPKQNKVTPTSHFENGACNNTARSRNTLGTPCQTRQYSAQLTAHQSKNKSYANPCSINKHTMLRGLARLTCEDDELHTYLPQSPRMQALIVVNTSFAQLDVVWGGLRVRLAVLPAG